MLHTSAILVGLVHLIDDIFHSTLTIHTMELLDPGHDMGTM